VSGRMMERELELRKHWLQRNNIDRSGVIFLLVNMVGTLMHTEGTVSEKEPYHLATIIYLHTQTSYLNVPTWRSAILTGCFSGFIHPFHAYVQILP